MQKPYSAVLTADEISAYESEPCMTCGSAEVVVQWLELAPGTQRYVHGLETCLACKREREGPVAGGAPRLPEAASSGWTDGHDVAVEPIGEQLGDPSHLRWVAEF